MSRRSWGFPSHKLKWDACRQRARVRRACSCAGPAGPWTGSAAGLRAVPSQMRFRFERNKRPSGATTGRRTRTPLPPSLQSWGVPVELHLDKNGRLFRTARSSPRHTNIEEMGDGGGHPRRPVHSTDGRLFRSNRTLVTYDQPCVPRPMLCTHAYVHACVRACVNEWIQTEVSMCVDSFFDGKPNARRGEAAITMIFRRKTL